MIEMDQMAERVIIHIRSGLLCTTALGSSAATFTTRAWPAFWGTIIVHACMMVLGKLISKQIKMWKWNFNVPIEFHTLTLYTAWQCLLHWFPPWTLTFNSTCFGAFMDVKILVPACSNMNVYATSWTLQWALFCKLWVTSFSDLSISLSCHTTQWNQ